VNLESQIGLGADRNLHGEAMMGKMASQDVTVRVLAILPKTRILVLPEKLEQRLSLKRISRLTLNSSISFALILLKVQQVRRSRLMA
jgi:hypothetical protein